jgi:hypothetical protein
MTREAAGVVNDDLPGHPGAGVVGNGYQTGSLAEGLVAYYPLDDDSDTTTAVDATPLGNGGTINGATYAGSGQVGPDALSFDGSDDYVAVDTLSPAITDPVTVTGYVKKDSTTDTKAWFDHGAGRFTLSYEGQGSNGFDFSIYDDTNQNIITSGNTTTGSYVHVAGRYAGGVMQLFVDGVSQGTKSAPQIGIDTEGTHIGSHSGGKWYWDGDTDDVRIYDRALSQPEIEALANRTTTSPVPVEAVI